VEDLRNAWISNGKRAVLLVIFRQPGANIISAVDNVRQLLPELQASISPAIKLDVVMDRTLTVRASVRDIEFTLIISVILVVLVVRSEEHTSELQSPYDLVCRLLLEKKNK